MKFQKGDLVSCPFQYIEETELGIVVEEHIGEAPDLAEDLETVVGKSKAITYTVLLITGPASLRQCIARACDLTMLSTVDESGD